MKNIFIILLLCIVGCKSKPQRYELYIDGKNGLEHFGEMFHNGIKTDSGYIFIRQDWLENNGKRVNDTFLISIHKIK